MKNRTKESYITNENKVHNVHSRDPKLVVVVDRWLLLRLISFIVIKMK